MGKKAQEKVMQIYSWEKIAEKKVSIYMEILKNQE
jgi:glycosyltransferase involved in cell wall biosynthesis